MLCCQDLLVVVLAARPAPAVVCVPAQLNTNVFTLAFTCKSRNICIYLYSCMIKYAHNANKLETECHRQKQPEVFHFCSPLSDVTLPWQECRRAAVVETWMQHHPSRMRITDTSESRNAAHLGCLCARVCPANKPNALVLCAVALVA